MELSFICTNGVGTVSNVVSGMKPIELVIAEGSNGGNSLKMYSKSIDYLFRGVTNFASGKILGVSVKIPHLGSITKNGSFVNWGIKTPKSSVVTYTVSKDSISESMYYSDAVLKEGSGIKPIENKGLLQLKGEQLKTNVLKGIISLGESKLPYYYSYESNNLVLKERETDKIIDIDDIEEDDIYIGINLLNLFMSKSEHLGVVLIDCAGFSDSVLSFIIDMHKIYQKEYGISLLFMYNLSENTSIKTDKVYLPDIDKSK